MTIDEHQNQCRTRKRAGQVDDIPECVPTITNHQYRDAITLHDNQDAYLQPLSISLGDSPLSSADNLIFDNGQLLFAGMPATAATLQNYYSNENVERINLPLLRVFYAIILNRFAETWIEDRTIDEIVTVYYPDMAKKIGISANVNEKNRLECIAVLSSFRNIMGVINRGKRGNDILPVFVYMGNDVEKNTIRFASPYMTRIICDIYNASIRRNKKNLPITNKNGSPLLLPSHSYLIKSSITSEKNKRAVEIVFIIVALIEQAGGTSAHINAKSIIERHPVLQQSIKNETSKRINTILERTFIRAWELLSEQTLLADVYKNINLPDTKSDDFKSKWIPTSSTLNMVFTFNHDGKKTP